MERAGFFVHNIHSNNCIMMAVLYFYHKIKASEEEVLQNSLIHSQIDELTGHVHSMEKVYSDFRGIRHDINNHIMVLGNLIKENNSDQALQYLHDWSEDFHAVDINAKTGKVSAGKNASGHSSS